MPDKPASERTEQPTPKRLEKARQKGQVPQSKEFVSFVSIATLMTITFFAAGGFCKWFNQEMLDAFSCNTAMFADNGAFCHYVNKKIVSVFGMMFPFFAALVAGAVAAGLTVGGWTFSFEALEPKLSAISPASGVSNLFNTKTLVNLVLSIFKLLFVSLIVYLYLKNKTAEIMQLRWMPISLLLPAIGGLITGAVIRISLALLVIGLADMAYQKWKYIDELKMTKQEVKEENKQTEGSPEVKTRIRKIQIASARRRMLKDVPNATVVLVNPTHYAVAIKYETGKMAAPVLLAKGADHMAEQIRKVARAYGVPIIARPELTRAIYSTVRIGKIIPPALYIAVAEVLAAVYRMKKQRR